MFHCPVVIPGRWPADVIDLYERNNGAKKKSKSIVCTLSSVSTFSLERIRNVRALGLGEECAQIDNKVKTESNDVVGSMSSSSSVGQTIIYLCAMR